MSINGYAELQTYFTTSLDTTTLPIEQPPITTFGVGHRIEITSDNGTCALLIIADGEGRRVVISEWNMNFPRPGGY